MWVVQVVGSNWPRVRATRDTTIYHSPAWQRRRRVGEGTRETGTAEETDEKERKLLRRDKRKRRCRGIGAKEEELKEEVEQEEWEEEEEEVI